MSIPQETSEIRELFGWGQLATRAVTCLTENGITTVEQLRRVTYAELLEMPGIGPKVQAFIIQSLEGNA